MKEYHILFIIRLFFILGVVFGIHLLVLDYFNKPLFDALILQAYLVNLAWALVLYFTLFLLRTKFSGQLGFLFLLGSFLKFGLFFLIFDPHYKADNEITSREFLTFFIPYTFTLILEVYSLSKWMIEMDKK